VARYCGVDEEHVTQCRNICSVNPVFCLIISTNIVAHVALLPHYGVKHGITCKLFFVNFCMYVVTHKF